MNDFHLQVKAVELIMPDNPDVTAGLGKHAATSNAAVNATANAIVVVSLWFFFDDSFLCFFWFFLDDSFWTILFSFFSFLEHVFFTFSFFLPHPRDEQTPGTVETTRPRGQNDIGMVAWLFTMHTPEARHGRQMILISNDITFKAGSFGTKEDALFLRASAYARQRGLPRIYRSGETIEYSLNNHWIIIE